jgi:hypothetical protein
MRTHARILFAVVALAPAIAVTACDMMKKDAPDAGVAPVPTPVAVGIDAALVAPPVVPTDPGPAPPLGGTTTAVNPTPTGTTTVRPVAVDGAAPPPPAADAGAKPAPTPAPTFPVIPGFDAGAFVPPAFDAGGFKPPWQK